MYKFIAPVYSTEVRLFIISNTFETTHNVLIHISIRFARVKAYC